MAVRTSTKTSITGHGVWHPDTVLENPELCATFNEFVRRENLKNADAIAAGKMEPLKESTPEWVVKASGIIRRYVEDKTGLLDPERMCPNIADRPESELSIQAEYALNALVPPDERGTFSLRLILHGRRVCAARRPRCDVCVLAGFCPSAGIADTVRATRQKTVKT